MPLSVWATTRMGWFCSQKTRICGSERMIEIGGGEAALEAAHLGDGAALLALGAHHGQPEQGAGEQRDAADERCGGDGLRAEQRQRQHSARGDAGANDQHAGKARRSERHQLA